MNRHDPTLITVTTADSGITYGLRPKDDLRSPGDELFERALAWLLSAEGGYSNNPLDHGGATKYGITRRSWADYVHRDDVTPEDIAALTTDDARRFYREMYWRPLGGDQLIDRPNVAIALFDIGVLHGLHRAVRLAQLCLDTKPDGIMGPDTRNKLMLVNEQEFFLRFVPAFTMKIVSIVDTDPTQQVFLRGWMSRSMRLLRLVEA